MQLSLACQASNQPTNDCKDGISLASNLPLICVGNTVPMPAVLYCIPCYVQKQALNSKQSW